MHQQVHRDGESGRGAELFLSVGHGHHLGGDGFWHSTRLIRISSKHANIDPASGWHKDFTVDGEGPFDDKNGHGTHVAGIIAGEWRVPPDAPKEIQRPLAVSRYLKKDTEDIEYQADAARWYQRDGAAMQAC